jgi:hypothetical protein
VALFLKATISGRFLSSLPRQGGSLITVMLFMELLLHPAQAIAIAIPRNILFTIVSKISKSQSKRRLEDYIGSFI